MFAIIFATGRRLARNKRRHNISSVIILSTVQFAYVFGSDVFCFPLFLSHVCEQEETTTRLFLRRRMCLWNLILSLCPRGKLPLLTVSARKPSCSVGKPLPLADCLLYHWLWTHSFIEMSMRLKLDKRNRTSSFKFESFFVPSQRVPEYLWDILIWCSQRINQILERMVLYPHAS